MYGKGGVWFAASRPRCKLESRIERRFSSHDQAIVGILGAIRELMTPPEPARKRRIGLVQAD